MDLNAIRKRLSQLQTTNNRTSSLWKPQPGKTQIRIVPYSFNKDNPFIELFFHYNLNNRSYLSPISFGRPDPIEEFAQKLRGSGNKEDYQLARKLEAKMIAKSNWLLGSKKKHKDDIAELKILIGCDDCQPIKMIGNWEIELTLENNCIEETNYPDWYGYKRIDKI